jgi:hypothetical protein
MTAPTILPLVGTAADVTAAAAAFGIVPANNATPDTTAVTAPATPTTPASIVELSTEAQFLAANAAAIALENEVQITLAAAALNQATLAATIATSTAAENAALNIAPNTVPAPIPTANAATVPTAATTAPPPPAAAPVPASAPPVLATPAEVVPNTALAALAALIPNPAIPVTDPAVAAAIAAYRLGDGLLAENEEPTGKTPVEEDIGVVATPRIQGTKIDLHDSARDDVLNGPVWNWLRVNPIQGKFTKR